MITIQICIISIILIRHTVWAIQSLIVYIITASIMCLPIFCYIVIIIPYTIIVKKFLQATTKRYCLNLVIVSVQSSSLTSCWIWYLNGNHSGEWNESPYPLQRIQSTPLLPACLHTNSPCTRWACPAGCAYCINHLSLMPFRHFLSSRVSSNGGNMGWQKKRKLYGSLQNYALQFWKSILSGVGMSWPLWSFKTSMKVSICFTDVSC